jgi:hypothetical protein
MKTKILILLVACCAVVFSSDDSDSSDSSDSGSNPSGTGGGATPSSEEIEYCTYNLNVQPGDSFNIRNFVRTKDTHAIPDFSTIFFTYTEAGADDQTNPAGKK